MYAYSMTNDNMIIYHSYGGIIMGGGTEAYHLHAGRRAGFLRFFHHQHEENAGKAFLFLSGDARV